MENMTGNAPMLRIAYMIPATATKKLETMQAKKDDVIMIGDRKFDIEGAHAIGIPCIAVEYGYGDRDEFKAHGADYIAKTTEDVEKLF